MLVYGVPRDPPPHGLSFEAMVLDDPNYEIGAFDACADTSRDYFTWFAEFSMGHIIGDVPVSGGKVLGGAIHAQVATRAEWRPCVGAVEARVTEFEALFATREAHMQKDTTWALAKEW